jgi:fibro-slime domain-containing protein
MKYPRLLVAALVVLMAPIALGLATCGRTDLDAAEPCLPTDTTRPCLDVCGAGQQACIDGTWHACEVPTATRACSGPCGDGMQECTGGRWQSCVIPLTRSCSTVCGGGKEACNATTGVWGACDAPKPKPPTLHAVIRDFHETHPDFESAGGDMLDLGIVATMLGADNKPVYAGNPTTPSTTGAASFNQWYNDVPGQNERTMIDLPLMSQTGMPDQYLYNNTRFFPIDGQLFGNEGNPHNFHFTMESHTHFQYVAGQTFFFAGDDDVFVFVNRRLAINLGGVHSVRSASVDLDASASTLGINQGGDYDLDIFYAERHTFGAAFEMYTNVNDASSCE